MYSVSNPKSIIYRVIPFFKKFQFISKRKKANFKIFCQITKLVFDKQHLNRKGLIKIVKLRSKLNQGKGRTRKYLEKDVIKTLKDNPQRLYAKPRTFRDESSG